MKPFQTILFAADFSPNSQEAFHAACALVIDNKTRLIVLHVAEPNLVPEEPVYFGQQSMQFHADIPDASRHEALKRGLREVYAPDRPIEVDFLTREGNAAAEILHVAHDRHSDLIVMGTHGRTGVRRMVAGSVAISVLRQAECPVLALRSADHPHASKPIDAILHATDFSEDSEAALRVARSLARHHGARLIILHVATLEVLTDGTNAAEVDPREYRDALEQIKQRVDGPDLKQPVETMLKRGFPAEGIIEAADEVGCDLIVMGTHGRTGLRRLLMGSVAEFVVPRANCPVMVLKRAEFVPAATADETVGEPVAVS